MTVADSERLRLLYVGTLPPHQGGSAIMSAQLLRGLAKRGHQIDAISPIDGDAAGGGEAYAQDNPELSVVRFGMPYMDISPDAPPADDYRDRERQQLPRLVHDAVARRRPDVVIIGRESFAPSVVELARASSLPTVLLIQGATTNGILLGTYPAARAEALLATLREVDLLVASAPHMQLALEALGVPGVEVIPNPVDLERFTPRAAPEGARSRDSPVVAHISNLKPIKRAHDFLDAAAIAAREDEHLSFVVVGDGPNRPALERAAAEHGLGERVRFTGWIGHDRMPAVVNSVDIVVMPSAGEAQALAYLETQACERTLIASDIPAAREVVQDGETGLLHPLADVGALAQAILTAAGDAALRRRLGRQARAGLGEHALPGIVARYEAALRRVLAGGQARRGSVSPQP